MLLFIMKLALSILEEKYAIQILWRLREKDEIFLQELGRELGNGAPVNNTIVRKRIDAFVEAGLVKKRLEMKPPRRIYVELTNKGRSFADDLVNLENKLNKPLAIFC
jgi:DNA-binding HxlR family transcriptional regulator